MKLAYCPSVPECSQPPESLIKALEDLVKGKVEIVYVDQDVGSEQDSCEKQNVCSCLLLSLCGLCQTSHLLVLSSNGPSICLLPEVDRAARYGYHGLCLCSLFLTWLGVEFWKF
jgi:hypothetical protein